MKEARTVIYEGEDPIAMVGALYEDAEQALVTCLLSEFRDSITSFLNEKVRMQSPAETVAYVASTVVTYRGVLGQSFITYQLTYNEDGTYLKIERVERNHT